MGFHLDAVVYGCCGLRVCMRFYFVYFDDLQPFSRRDVAISSAVTELGAMKKAVMLLLFLMPIALFGQPTPPNLPSYRIDWYQDTMICNYMFLSTERFVLPATLPSTAMILDRRGYVVWYATSEDNLFTFSPQPNGTLAFNVNDQWYALDSAMNPIAKPTCAGIANDFHDKIDLASGHILELCSADTTMDLRGLYTYSGQEGDSMAAVRYNVVNELDANGAIVKHWRGIDHFSPADIDSLYFFYPWYLELNHTNSMDFDGQHLLLSHRANHEVTLVDWGTGNVLWRLGGPNNDFFYLNDGGFKSQHDARFVGPGRISLLDNRSIASVRAPRAVLYALDTTLWLATKVYERVDATLESSSMGSFRVLANGDGLVSWGTTAPNGRPNLSYYHGNGQKVCDIVLQDNHKCYRAVCDELPFAITRPEIVCDRQNNQLVLQATGSYPSQLWSTGSTSQLLVVQDTGYYQLYVPLGMGFVGSNVFHITDLEANCPSTPAADPSDAARPAVLLETYDLLGRPASTRVAGQIYIERYRDGRSRKVIHY